MTSDLPADAEDTPRSLPAHRFDLSGRVAIVTGSTTGLGRALAFALADAGAHVTLNYSGNRERAEATLRDFEDGTRRGVLVRADATTEAGIETLCTETEAAAGPIDTIVCNACPPHPARPFARCDWAYHAHLLDFFLKSPVLLTQRVLPGMRARGFGRVIAIGSEVVHEGTPQLVPYVAAKGALNGMIRSLATELAPDGITANTISPGWIPVERHAGVAPQEFETYRASVPIGRQGVPDDLAGAAIFLASTASSFVTGQNIHVNGGRSVF